MTFEQLEQFYRQNRKKYNIAKNKQLLIWLKEKAKKGYQPYIDIASLQELIDNIVYWYEMKYPEREMEFYEGVKDYDFKNIKSLSKFMDIKQLLFRLPYQQAALLECNYRSTGAGVTNLYNDKGEIVGRKGIIFMSIKRKNIDPHDCMQVPNFLLCADYKTGEVKVDSNIKDMIDADCITLDELLMIMRNTANDFDFTSLEECIYAHDCDKQLRDMILQLVALKLLYSPRTIPERGYERATRCINEFNKKLNLSLSTHEIDEVMHKNNTNSKKGAYVLKK